MKFSRKQEQFLVELGIKTLLESLIKEKKPKGRKWTPEQRKKFKSSMAKKWAEDKKKGKK